MKLTIMWHPTTILVIMIIKVLQLNCQKRKQTTMDILNRRDADLILLQEPHLVSATKRPSNDPRWISIYCDHGNGKIRAASYVRRHSKMAGLVTKLDYTNNDLVAIEISNIKIINIYNQKVGKNKEEALKYFMKIHENIQIENTIIAGDFNAHHTDWHDNTNTDKAGRELVEWLFENEMVLCSTKNVITRELGGRQSVIDLVFASQDISTDIDYNNNLDNPLDVVASDHKLQQWKLYLDNNDHDLGFTTTLKKYNIKKADWDLFDDELTNQINDKNMPVGKIKYTWKIDRTLEMLESAVTTAISTAIPETKAGPWAKSYWTDDLKEIKRLADVKMKEAEYSKSQEDVKEAAKAYDKYEKETQRLRTEEWNNFISSLRNNDIWKVNRYIKPRENQQVMSQLKKEDGRMTMTLAEKREYLWNNLLPSKIRTVSQPPEVVTDDRWPTLTENEIGYAISNLPNGKAPGPDCVTGSVLKMAWKNNAFRKQYTILLTACIDLGYHPTAWRTGTIVVLRKPGKKDYSDPKAYRPITLLKIPGKVLERIVQRRLAFLSRDILPREQFGAREGYCASDAVLELVHQVKMNKTDTTAMMIDIKGAFDNVNRETLLSTMRQYKLPSAAISWVYHFVSDRSASMLIDGVLGRERGVETGVPQGSPVSPLLFLIYTAPLYEVIKETGARVSGFVDDITVHVEGERVENANRLCSILKKCCDWAKSRSTEIDLGPKLGFIHFTKKKRRKKRKEKNDDEKFCLLLPNGEKKESQSQVKLLGIILDEHLTFKEHIANALLKANRASGIIARLGGIKNGMSGMAIRSLFLACVRPIFEYGIEVWNFAIQSKDKDRFRSIQGNCLKRALGAVKTTSFEVLEIEAAVPPVHFRLEYLAAMKSIRLKYGLNRENPVSELSTITDEKSPIGYNMKHLSNLEFPKSPDLPPGKAPWLNDRDRQEYDKKWQEFWLEAKKVKKDVVEALLVKWQHQYNSGERGKHEWYRNIVPDAQVSLTVPKLITKQILRNESRRILSIITQLRTGHGSCKEWFERFHISQDSLECECGVLKTKRHILTECVYYDDIRQELKRVSPALNLSVLLNTKQGLQAIVSFWKLRDESLSTLSHRC